MRTGRLTSAFTAAIFVLKACNRQSCQQYLVSFTLFEDTNAGRIRKSWLAIRDAFCNWAMQAA
jgi:hypothetical protein